MTTKSTKPDLRVERGGQAPPPNGSLGVQLPDHLPPQAAEAEQATLGAALISASAVARVLEMLERGDFYIEAHRRIYDAVAYLAEAQVKVDSLTLAEELRRRGQLELIGGMAYVNALWESVPTAAHVEYYARTVQEKSTLRKLVEASGQIAAQAHEQEDDVDAITQSAWLMIDRIAQHRARRRGFDGVTAAQLMGLEFPPVQWVLPGIFAQGLSILAGKSKMGKSWLLYQLAVAVALGGTALGSAQVEPGRVLYLALEDTKRRLKNRLETILEGGAPPERLHLFTRWPKMREGGQRDLMAWFRQYPDTRLVIIDTFAKIRSHSERPGNAYDEDTRAMTEVKDIADEHDSSIIVAHHFNKLKPSEDWVDSVSGSSGLPGVSDGIVGFFRERDAVDATLKVTGRDIDDESDRALVYSPKPLWLLRGRAAQYIEDRDLARVLALLVDQGALSPAHIAEELDWNRQTTKSKLFRWAEKGLVRTTSRGLYGHVPQSSETAENENHGNLQPMQPATGATVQPQSETATLFSDAALSGNLETVAVAPVANFHENETVAVAPVAKNEENGAVAPVADFHQNGVGAPDGGESERRAVLLLACDCAFPALEVEGRAVPAGEAAWSHATKTLHRDWMPWLRAALETREGDGLSPDSALADARTHVTPSLSLEEEEGTAHAHEEGHV